jgi:hypothetical protein
MKSFAQIAYEAYCHNRQWISFRSEPLPKWIEVNPEIKDAWEEATAAVLDEAAKRNIKEEEED